MKSIRNHTSKASTRTVSTCSSTTTSSSSLSFSSTFPEPSLRRGKMSKTKGKNSKSSTIETHSVQFIPTVQVKIIPSMKDLSDDMIGRIWYNSDEMHVMKLDAKKQRQDDALFDYYDDGHEAKNFFCKKLLNHFTSTTTKPTSSINIAPCRRKANKNKIIISSQERHSNHLDTSEHPKFISSSPCHARSSAKTSKKSHHVNDSDRSINSSNGRSSNSKRKQSQIIIFCKSR